MLNDAKRYKTEDGAAAARIQSKNGLESNAYNLRNALQDQKVSTKLEAGSKENLDAAVEKAIECLDISYRATIKECEGRQKESEEIANTIS